MPRLKSEAVKSPQAPAIGNKTNQVLDASTTALENALKVLEMLSAVTEDVPYLNGITGCIQKLIAIQQTMSDNKTRADDLLTNVGEVSRVIAQGLYDLDKGSRNNVMMRLNADLEKYQIVLNETHDILKDWMSKSFVKRLWAHGDFPGIADGIDRRINGFRDAFSVSRLIALSKGQDALDTKLQKLVDQNVRRNLEKWLQPAEVAVSQRDAANKRHSTTGQWLLDFAEFRDWIYAPNALLWLEGISGSGKTVLSSTIISSLRGRAEPLAFFYFDTNNSGQHTITQLLCSLVTQLSAQAPSPDQKLNALWVSYARGQHLPSDSELIAKALIPILGEFADPVYIVLDALDECSQRDQLLNAIGKIVDADLPNVHLLLTSRPEVPRGSRLVERAVSISLKPECINEDIESYIIEILSTLEGDWSDERKDQIKTGLLVRGAGMFRLVSLQLDQLRDCDGRESQVTKALSEMPTSLDTIYHRILHNIRNPDMISNVGRVMNWLLFSERPMMLNEIIDALAFDFDKEPLRFNGAERMRPKALLDACAGFITVSEDAEGHIFTIKLAHASVKEYFLSTKGPNCEVSDQKAHHLMARTCIGYLCSFDHVPDSDADLQRYPLALYAAKNWDFHAAHCDELRLWDYEPERLKNPTVDVFHVWYWLLWVLLSPLTSFLRLFPAIKFPSEQQNGNGPKIAEDSSNPMQLVEAILELLQPESPQYTTLYCLYDIDTPALKVRPIPPPLYLAASIGLTRIAWELLNRGSNVNAQGGFYGTALKAASFRGNTDLVHLLLDQGAAVNTQDRFFGNPLQGGCNGGHTEIVRLLIEHGADVNAQGGHYGNALQAACNRGNPEIVDLLLEAGAEVDAQGGSHGGSLQAAFFHGHTDIVCLLLKRGAKINREFGPSGTILQAAAWEGYTDIVQLLLEKGVDVNTEGGLNGNALQAASSKGYTEIVRLLLEHGAVLDAQAGER